jgi:hypothetical protein
VSIKQNESYKYEDLIERNHDKLIELQNRANLSNVYGDESDDDTPYKSIEH